MTCATKIKKVLKSGNYGRCQLFNTIADDLEFIPKDDPETCHRNFDPSWREYLILGNLWPLNKKYPLNNKNKTFA